MLNKTPRVQKGEANEKQELTIAIYTILPQIMAGLI